MNVIAGAAELSGGLAILPGRTRPAARWWLLATLVAVYPANVHMAIRPERFPKYPPSLAVGAPAGAGRVRLADLARNRLTHPRTGVRTQEPSELPVFAPKQNRNYSIIRSSSRSSAAATGS
jgi:hypothetical protein